MCESDDRPHRAALRKGRVSIPGQAYFITKCTHLPDSSVLARPDCAAIVVNCLLWMRDNGRWRILGFVVMPNHYHVVMALRNVKSLSDAMWSMDKYTGARVNRLIGRKGAFWEEGFYDHAIRDRDDFDNILAYMHDNPVEAELVDSADLWRYSTAHPKYAPEIDCDWLGPSLPKRIAAKHRFSRNAIPHRYR